MVLWCHAAHARLMFRNEVTRLDAITAILCIESSMTISAIVDSMGNALHSNFSEEPDQECILFRHYLTFVPIYVQSPPLVTWSHLLEHCGLTFVFVFPNLKKQTDAKQEKIILGKLRRDDIY